MKNWNGSIHSIHSWILTIASIKSSLRSFSILSNKIYNLIRIGRQNRLPNWSGWGSPKTGSDPQKCLQSQKSPAYGTVSAAQAIFIGVNWRSQIGGVFFNPTDPKEFIWRPPEFCADFWQLDPPFFLRILVKKWLDWPPFLIEIGTENPDCKSGRSKPTLLDSNSIGKRVQTDLKTYYFCLKKNYKNGKII